MLILEIWKNPSTRPTFIVRQARIVFLQTRIVQFANFKMAVHKYGFISRIGSLDFFTGLLSIQAESLKSFHILLFSFTAFRQARTTSEFAAVVISSKMHNVSSL